MRHRVILATAIPFTMSLTACRTANPGTENVQLIQGTPPAHCKNLGIVNIDWAWWGTSTEVLNVMKNQTVEKGGDTLSLSHPAIGTAYNCKTTATAAPEDPDKSKIIIPQ